MITSAGAAYKSPVAAVRRPVEPRESQAPAEEAEAPARTTPPQFAMLLGMISNSPNMRSELLRQVPDENGSLLDKMLEAAQGASGDMGVASAADAVRYGMLQVESMPDTPAGLASTLGISGLNGATSSGQSRISQEVLARIAGRKAASIEDLMALGDRDGAMARAKLDALLATAGTSDAAALAAANALAAALAASASDVATPLKSTDGLDPEFRARLDKVIQRMNDEFGSDVTLVETVRSQERQDSLYAQGRTAPGPVVTWTQDSAHKRGLAADVLVDNDWKNDKGFARLQAIAKEEGLRTLGDIDPGHLELPADSATIAAGNRAASKASDAAASQNGVARVASVASVAAVASVGKMTPQKASEPTLAAPLNNASLGIMAQATRGSESRSASQDAGQDNAARRERGADMTRSTSDETAAFGELTKSASHKFIGPVDATERPSVTAAGSVERVQSIHDLREQAPAAPVSQIKLEIDGDNGDTQHITIDMRGNNVGTSISTDAASADRMRARVGDLQSSLEGHGLQVDTVRISSTTRPADAAEQVKQVSAGERDVIRLGGANASGSGEGNMQQGQRERSNATRDWEDRQAAREDQRRSGKQQQDRQRPQYQEKQ